MDLTRSITLTARTVALKQAVILACRAFYDAEPMIRPTASMYALIAPWRRLDADAPGTLVTVLDEAPTGDVPETPLTPTVATVTRHLLASTDDTFAITEVVLTDATGSVALKIPAGTVPAGERRYIAYWESGRTAAYDHVYLYPEGHRDTQTQLAGWQDGPNLTIAGLSGRLLRTRGSYTDVANGLIVEAE